MRLETAQRLLRLGAPVGANAEYEFVAHALLTMTPEERQQAADRKTTAARLLADDAEQQRHNRAMEGNAAATQARLAGGAGGGGRGAVSGGLTNAQQQAAIIWRENQLANDKDPEKTERAYRVMIREPVDDETEAFNSKTGRFEPVTPGPAWNRLTPAQSLTPPRTGGDVNLPAPMKPTTPKAGQVVKGSTVVIKGKRYKVDKVNPDGTFEGTLIP